jgi:uncharacterized phage protein (TIGR01671 family)
MRDILFRAKSGQTWYYGGVHREKLYRGSIETNDYHYRWHIITDEGDEYRVRPDTICQYTGLTDKNGTKIFEGDIVKHEWEFLSNGNYHHYEDFIVEFKDSAYYIVPIKKHENIWTVYLNPKSEYEVVGNIYDDNI